MTSCDQFLVAVVLEEDKNIITEENHSDRKLCPLGIIAQLFGSSD